MGIQVGARASMSSLLNLRITLPAPLPVPVPAKQMREAQRILKKAGFPRDQVAEFQTAVGLAANGVIDAPTFKALERVQRRMKVRGRIGPGQRDKKVRTIKVELRALGYYHGPIDTIYDLEVARGVRLLREDQPDLTNGSGVITPRAQRVLRREYRRLQHAPYRVRVKNTRSHQKAEARALRETTRAHDKTGIGLGDRSDVVAYIKQHLKAAGYEAPGPKRLFDERTEAMVKRFQSKTPGLEVTGRVNRDTWLALRRAKIEATNATNPPQRIGEHGPAVAREKKKLRELHYHPGGGDLYTRGEDREVNRFRRREHLGGIGRGITPRVDRALDKEIKKQRERKRGIKATGYINGRAFTIRIVKVQGYWVEVNTAKAYNRMRKAAAKDGIFLQINSGFRTNERQRELYECWINRVPNCNPANPPGFSNHQSGIALDLNTTGPTRATGSGPVYNWLARNGWRYGFQRIPTEHWHWEYHR